MNEFMDYYHAGQKEYPYRLKIAVDDMSDEMIDKIILCLDKYNPKTATPFKRTPIQENPLDFPKLKYTPVFISDITIEYPATLDFLRNKISEALGLPLQNVVIYSETDPREIETQRYIDWCLSEDEKQPKLGKDDYEGETDAGESYEDQRLSFIKELESSKEKHDDLPNDYHSYEETAEQHSPGLFGRMKSKD